VEHFWTVRWSLAQPYTAETLPYPAVHVVIERDRSEIVGVMDTRFSRTLTGRGTVLGIRFRPGGFRPFLGAPVRMNGFVRSRISKKQPRSFPLSYGLGCHVAIPRSSAPLSPWISSQTTAASFASRSSRSRYRFHEAAELLAAGRSDIATIAQDLQYFDHAHFTKEFKAVVGTPPAEFGRRHRVE